jgi:hypothetical protein
LSTRLDDLKNKHYLIALLVAIVIVYLIANVIHQEKFPINDRLFMTDLLSIFGSLIVIIFGVLLSLKYKARGNIGVAWILFTLAMGSWFIGEYAYTYEYEYNIEDLSTLTSDFFYIIGYPLFLGFTIFYLKPRKNIITKKMILASSLFSLLGVIPSLYIAFDSVGDADALTLFLYVIYPILDGIILIPSIVAVFLFFRGQVNLLWTMILFGIMLNVAADTAYLIFSLDETFYAGHPVNILYVWAYVLYGCGAVSHLKLFKKSK